MVTAELRDGVRIAALVASELTGHTDPPFDEFAVTDADPDVEPTVDGARAYDVTYRGTVLATMVVQPDRARLDVCSGLEAARTAAATGGLRTRPFGDPPRLRVFVETGAAAKRVRRVLAAAVSGS
jgi:hypothetical protein